MQTLNSLDSRLMARGVVGLRENATRIQAPRGRELSGPRVEEPRRQTSLSGLKTSILTNKQQGPQNFFATRDVVSGQTSSRNSIGRAVLALTEFGMMIGGGLLGIFGILQIVGGTITLFTPGAPGGLVMIGNGLTNLAIAAALIGSVELAKATQ